MLARIKPLAILRAFAFGSTSSGGLLFRGSTLLSVVILLDTSSSAGPRNDLLHHFGVVLIRLGPIVVVHLRAHAYVQMGRSRQLPRILDLAAILYKSLATAFLDKEKNKTHKNNSPPQIVDQERLDVLGPQALEPIIREVEVGEQQGRDGGGFARDLALGAQVAAVVAGVAGRHKQVVDAREEGRLRKRRRVARHLALARQEKVNGKRPVARRPQHRRVNVPLAVKDGVDLGRRGRSERRRFSLGRRHGQRLKDARPSAARAWYRRRGRLGRLEAREKVGGVYLGVQRLHVIVRVRDARVVGLDALPVVLLLENLEEPVLVALLPADEVVIHVTQILCHLGHV